MQKTQKTVNTSTTFSKEIIFQRTEKQTLSYTKTTKQKWRIAMPAYGLGRLLSPDDELHVIWCNLTGYILYALNLRNNLGNFKMYFHIYGIITRFLMKY